MFAHQHTGLGKNMFGDLCPGARKYLEVKYECVKSTQQPKYFACNNKDLKLDCGPGKYMDIESANYGRKVQLFNCIVLHCVVCFSVVLQLHIQCVRQPLKMQFSYLHFKHPNILP